MQGDFIAYSLRIKGILHSITFTLTVKTFSGKKRLNIQLIINKMSHGVIYLLFYISIHWHKR
jgi:hypothetical protein